MKGFSDHNLWTTYPNFIVSVSVLNNCEGGPKTKIQLFSGKVWGNQNISFSRLTLPCFTFSNKNWAYLLAISKKNHQFLLIFEKYFWTWSLDMISKFSYCCYPHLKSQLWTPGHITSSRLNFHPNQIWGIPWDVKSLETPRFWWLKGPLAMQFLKRGYFFADPERVHGTRNGSHWYLKG